MRTWLVVAAEEREFAGILRRSDRSKRLEWPAQFAREIDWKGDRWLLVANGPGERLVSQLLKTKVDVSGIISTGFCGALDPALKIGDIVEWRHGILTRDRVAVTAEEKRKLRESTGAAAVEMEAAAVEGRAREWNVPFHCIRAVSDRADEDMPVDFNLYRDRQGRFSRSRIAAQALKAPFTRIRGLLQLDRQCRVAAEALGEFFAHNQL